MNVKNFTHKPRTNPIQKQMLPIWDEWYEKNNPFKYQYQGKDFKHLALLANKLKSIDPEGNQVDNFKAFIYSITSEWHISNASIALFDSHFNQLISMAYKKTSKSQLEEFNKLWS